MDTIAKLFRCSCWIDFLKLVLIIIRLEKLLLPDVTVTGMVKQMLRAINKLGEAAALSDLYERKRMTLFKDRLSNTHFKLRTKLNLQKTIGRNYWNSNNYRSNRMLQQLLNLDLPSTKRFVSLTTETENSFKTQALSAFN